MVDLSGLRYYRGAITAFGGYALFILGCVGAIALPWVGAQALEADFARTWFPIPTWGIMLLAGALPLAAVSAGIGLYLIVRAGPEMKQEEAGLRDSLVYPPVRRRPRGVWTWLGGTVVIALTLVVGCVPLPVAHHLEFAVRVTDCSSASAYPGPEIPLGSTLAYTWATSDGNPVEVFQGPFQSLASSSPSSNGVLRVGPELGTAYFNSSSGDGAYSSSASNTQFLACDEPSYAYYELGQLIFVNATYYSGWLG